ncbi:MAG: hypothetical protein GY926_00010 [bacterium]|nr:hypothetical protein [bacterium]
MMEREIDQAVSDLAGIAARLGLDGPRRTPEGSVAVERIEQVRREIAPLELPADVVYFWSNWDYRSFDVLDVRSIGLLSPMDALAERSGWVGLEYPSILLPLTRVQYSCLSIELHTASAEGGRLFDLSSHFESYLVGSGVVDMLTLLATALWRGSDPTGPGEDNAYFGLLDNKARELGSVEAGIPIGEWPQHWLEAEGFDEEGIAPRGATHSIAQFEAERQDRWPLHAFLRGEWKFQAGVGGVEYGSLTDETGSVVLRVPVDVPNVGLGSEKQVEFEVESVGPSEQTKPASVQLELFHSDIADLVVSRLERQTTHDPSLRVLAIRRADQS